MTLDELLTELKVERFAPVQIAPKDPEDVIRSRRRVLMGDAYVDGYEDEDVDGAQVIDITTRRAAA